MNVGMDRVRYSQRNSKAGQNHQLRNNNKWFGGGKRTNSSVKQEENYILQQNFPDSFFHVTLQWTDALPLMVGNQLWKSVPLRCFCQQEHIPSGNDATFWLTFSLSSSKRRNCFVGQFEATSFLLKMWGHPRAAMQNTAFMTGIFLLG